MTVTRLEALNFLHSLNEKPSKTRNNLAVWALASFATKEKYVDSCNRLLNTLVLCIILNSI